MVGRAEGEEALVGIDPSGNCATDVKPGTRVFISELSVECSSAEPFPFHGTTPAQLATCVRKDTFGPNIDLTIHRVMLDGQNVPLRFVLAPAQHVNVPADNILGPTIPAQQATSVAEGWLAVLHPMTPGTHLNRCVPCVRPLRGAMA